MQYSPRMMQATHSLLDFSYKAQFPAHSNISLQLMIKDLKTYYSSIKVFIDNGVRCNAKGNTIHHFRIPKHHNLRHFVDDICDHGTMDNGSSEITKSLHNPTFIHILDSKLPCPLRQLSQNVRSPSEWILVQLHPSSLAQILCPQCFDTLFTIMT